jgi:hypothetical protein
MNHETIYFKFKDEILTYHMNNCHNLFNILSDKLKTSSRVELKIEGPSGDGVQFIHDHAVLLYFHPMFVVVQYKVHLFSLPPNDDSNTYNLHVIPLGIFTQHYFVYLFGYLVYPNQSFLEFRFGTLQDPSSFLHGYCIFNKLQR